MAGAIGAVVKLAAESGMRMIPDNAVGAGFIGKYLGYMGTNLSPALLGVGYIVGLNVGIVVVSGSILSFNIAIPIYHAFFLDSDPALAARIVGAGAAAIAGMIWSAKIRYLGVGAMLIGGVWTLFSLRKSLVSGITQRLRRRAQGHRRRSIAETERDLPMKWMLIALVVFVMPLALLYQAIVGMWYGQHPDDDHHDRRRIPVRLGVGVSRRPRRLVEQSGVRASRSRRSCSLRSCSCCCSARDSPIGAVAAIMIGAVVCCAAAVGGDNLQDLKAGYIVGATPWKQQLMLMIGAFSCALIMAPVLNLLAAAYGIGPPTRRASAIRSRRRRRR